MAVRSVGEVDVEDHRVVDCPSHAVADDLLVVLRLDHGKWLVHMWPVETFSMIKLLQSQSLT